MTTTSLVLQALLLVSLVPVADAAVQPLPPLHDGAVITGPGQFQQLAELRIHGKVTLKNLTLDLKAPVMLANGATLVLEDVQINVSDAPGTPNGSSNLRCEGGAHLIIHHSTMAPAGSAHPIWMIKGKLDVDDFQTENSEFHLDHVHAKLNRLKIFELEISQQSQVLAEHLNLVFLSTHSSDNDQLQFADVPTEKPFARTMKLGSGAKANLKDAQVQIFLLYVHGAAQASLSHMDRVQLAIFPTCRGTLVLGSGRMGTGAQPAVFPGTQASDCPFRITLRDVNVDTWDVYAAGHADLTFRNSTIDELNAGGDAKIVVQDSNVYADWMAVTDNARLTAERSTVGALRLTTMRPDLATSQIRLAGKSHTSFREVRFDCGIVALDDAHLEIKQSSALPKYVQKSGNAIVQSDVPLMGSNP